MDEYVKKFIEENINLIENNKWEEIYQKKFPTGFTEALLDYGINPLELGLNYVPSKFLYKSNIKEFTIPNNITSVGKNAFENCSNLINITIGNSVKSIGEGAFSFCYNLTEVIIPNSVTSIGDDTFFGCDSLTSVVIPNSITSIGNFAFSYCRKLTFITYLGTKKEAPTKLKVKNKKWRENSAISKIICSDGVLEL